MNNFYDSICIFITEIAEVIAFLSSDKSSYLTGAAIEITGGYY